MAVTLQLCPEPLGVLCGHLCLPVQQDKLLMDSKGSFDLGQTKLLLQLI